MNVRHDNVTVFAGADAIIAGGPTAIDIGPGKTGWIKDWDKTGVSLTWKAHVAKAGEYELAVIACCPNGSVLELSVAGNTLRAKLNATEDRTILGLATLPAGDVGITVRAIGDKPNITFFSLEFVRPDVKAAMRRRAKAMRTDTKWLVDARYGLMFHWTSQAMPAHGPAKSYAQAVQDFNVQRFIDMVVQTGAGAIVFTTSHAEWYFPGPMAITDRILPGRTTKRDLVTELADGLGKHGIKLILYQNPGHDDAAWWRLTGFDKPDKTEYFALWCDIVAAIGEQYGDKVAGWWFDDSLFCHYPCNAPWERMLIAGRAGNPKRLVGFNSWTYPKATEFQDYFCGECFVEHVAEVGEKFLPVGGNGRFVGGPQDGLQAVSTLLFEEYSNWCHSVKDTPIAQPHFTVEQLAKLMKNCIARKNVPFFNLEIFQDGTVSQASLDVIRQANKFISL